MAASKKIDRSLSSFLSREWKQMVILTTPLLLSPLLIHGSEAKCGFVILLMSIYYMTEALPLPVTALIPVFAFPLLGIVSTNDICMVYMRGTTMVFVGGLVMAIAVEHSNLHRRIALFVILKLGQSPRQLLIGFLVTSMFLSMWISNTAAAAMMVPIVNAILQEQYKSELTSKQTEKKNNVYIIKSDKFCIQINDPDGKHHLADNNNTAPVKSLSIDTTENLPPPDDEGKQLSVMYFLSIVYGCNLGGTSFPTGTGPNLVLWGLLASSFPGGTGLDFGTWMAFNVPGMLVCIFFVWLWLEFSYMGFGCCRKVSKFSKEKEEGIKKVIQKQYDSLGRMTFHEKAVISLFISLVFLWIFRSPEMIPGWADMFHEFGITIGSASPAIFILVLLFVVPSQLPSSNLTEEPTQACLSWNVVQQKLPWGLIILVGGGFAMAEGAASSGLSHWIKFQLQYLKVLPGQVIVILVCLITSVLTEVITNITAASILLPVLKDMSISLHMHPFMLMIPATVCCSYAFMLPVSNPPNAMAYNASGMKTADMVKTGFALKVICILILLGTMNTWGVLLFDLNHFPDWAITDIADLSLVNVTLNDTQMVYL